MNIDKPEASAEQSQEEQTLKGGRIARQAAMLCQDSMFRLYLDRRRRYKQGMTEAQLPDGTHDAEDARDWLCKACDIQSRAELDHKHSAASTFHVIRKRYQRWRTGQGKAL